MSAVAFTMKKRPGEAADLEGVLRLEEDALILEWRKITQFFPRKKVVASTSMSFRDIGTIRAMRRWWKHYLVLVPARLEAIAEVPGEHPQGMLHLYIHRDQQDAARHLISVLELKISEVRLADAESYLGEDL